MTFRVGQKVVCVQAKGAECLRNERVYTCLGVERGFLRVDCCSEPNHHNYCGWMRSRFRPIVSRKTDISALKALLVPGAKIRETA